MRLGRKDYDGDIVALTEERIPKDEPVFLLRAQDKTADQVVQFWVFLNMQEGVDERMLSLARAQAKKMREWPDRKIADLPSGDVFPKMGG